MNNPCHDIIASHTDDVVERVLAAVGEQNVRSVFVAGSVAGGDASCRVDEGMVEVYSDVDLYVVVADGTDLETARSGAREAAAGAPLEGPGYHICSGPDVGVYTFDDLAAQPARPGTVGLGRYHRVVFGDGDLVGRASERIGEDIASEEALYLLENRLGELAAMRDDAASGNAPLCGKRFHTFVLCKTGLDVASAGLIDRGRFHPLRRERLGRFESLVEDSGDDPVWDPGEIAVVRDCRDRLDRLPSPDWDAGFDAAAEETVVAAVLSQWKTIAAKTLGGHPDDWCDLVLRRCHTGDYIGNFRQFRAMNTRCGFKRRGGPAAGVHLSRYSAADALRLSALTDFLSRSASVRPDIGRLIATLGPYLDRLTGGCGFTEGSLAQRSFRMYRAIQ